MYVFVKIQLPKWNSSSLCNFRADDAEALVESEGNTVVYA